MWMHVSGLLRGEFIIDTMHNDWYNYQCSILKKGVDFDYHLTHRADHISLSYICHHFIFVKHYNSVYIICKLRWGVFSIRDA